MSAQWPSMPRRRPRDLERDAPDGLSVPAAFAPGRKCIQGDTDGEVTIVLVIPESHSPLVWATFAQLRETPFVLTLTPGELVEED